VSETDFNILKQIEAWKTKEAKIHANLKNNEGTKT